MTKPANGLLFYLLWLFAGSAQAALPPSRDGLIADLPVSHPCALMSSQRLGKRASPYQEAIDLYAGQYRVESAIIKAVIAIESCYNQRALSPKGAQGLMQLIPETAERFGVNDAFDTKQNIHGGTRYLSWLLKRYQGDLHKVLAAYNAGEGKVDLYGGVPPYTETRHYVRNVLTVYHKLAEPESAAVKPEPRSPAATALSAVTASHPAIQDSGITIGGPGVPVRQQVALPVQNTAGRAVVAGHKPVVAKRVSSTYRSPVKAQGPSKPGRSGWQINKARAPQLYKH